MFYKCNKCGSYTWQYIVKEHHQFVKNGKRWNRCFIFGCGAYNNKKVENQYYTENLNRRNYGIFSEDKWILKGLLKKIE